MTADVQIGNYAERREKRGGNQEKKTLGREGVKNHEIVVMSSMDDPLNEWTNCEDNSGISFPSPVQLLGNKTYSTTESSIFGYLHLIKYGRERGRDTK